MEDGGWHQSRPWKVFNGMFVCLDNTPGVLAKIPQYLLDSLFIQAMRIFRGEFLGDVVRAKMLQDKRLLLVDLDRCHNLYIGVHLHGTSPLSTPSATSAISPDHCAAVLILLDRYKL